jgi:hypothetical protein
MCDSEEEEEERRHNRRRATEMAMIGRQEMMEKYPFVQDVAQTKPGSFYPPKVETERLQNRELVRIMLYHDKGGYKQHKIPIQPIQPQTKNNGIF